MALPHLTVNSARRNVYEQTIVNRRNNDNDNREQWSSRAKYFHQANVTAGKKTAWESNLSFKTSMDAWKSKNEQEVKGINLKRRRLKLAEMLRDERDSLEAEMKGLSSDNYERIESMRDQVNGLKSAREEQRQQLAHEKLYEHWRVNSPDLREIERDQHKKHVIGSWKGQIDEQKLLEEKAKEERERLERQMEEERQLAVQLEKQHEEDRLKDELELKSILKRQMTELKSREVESNQLKKQEELLQKQQWELEKLNEERMSMEANRRKMEFGKVLLRQHAAALRRKSQQIQQELQEDKKFLERLLEQDAVESEMMTARRERAQADAEWMKGVVEQQIKLEKAREAEMTQLYQDEAARVWQNREAEWSRERAARERLMKEVMDERKSQVDHRMKQVHKEQQESLERREELLRDMEKANELATKDAQQRHENKLQTKREIDAQVSARREKQLADELKLKLDFEDEIEQQKNYMDIMKSEADELSQRGYKPKDFSRRQAWI